MSGSVRIGLVTWGIHASLLELGMPVVSVTTMSAVASTSAALAAAQPSDGAGSTVQPLALPTLTTAFDWWVFAALMVPLVLATISSAVVCGYVLAYKGNLHKTVDKLAQLLSEGDSSKMSLSRVQALLFTYVLTFGCLLIIARTGQFPEKIPDDLAILAGGSLATYLISKAIQGSTNQSPQTPPENKDG